VRWLSRGGEDALTNLVLVCPNHHRANPPLRCAVRFRLQCICFHYRA
jgi:hypothetical protein